MTGKYISLIITLLFYATGYGQISPVGLLLRITGHFELVTGAALDKPSGATDSVYLFNVVMNNDRIKTTIFDFELNHLAVNRLMPLTDLRASDPPVIYKAAEPGQLKDVWDYTGTMPDSIKQTLPAQIRKRIPGAGILNTRGNRRSPQNYFVDGQFFKAQEPGYKINRLVFYGYAQDKLVSVLSYDDASYITKFDSLVYSKGRLSEAYHKENGLDKKMIVLYNSENKVQFVQVTKLTSNNYVTATSELVSGYAFTYDSRGYINTITKTDNGQTYTMLVEKQ